ncbi:quinone oxidoreductase family protein [Burkholderia oklahomensis]|uniref:Zinc-binding dehydrogenase family protein n=1 Tax=Burkholderia oklahomensis TaxID=342113 RepID=A0AAI8FQS9_9BURK|nr:zinc-binding alcohol dehydrogenase family protein [Burkholderia oklahomensis]AIO69300.1 zinc-binding dehydrogenase family protein [Burkholderia oklahomensis]AOI39741.1 alcohol dehydrogenase [Burkholderia oklahomensis EO147]KUY67715.1 alcohol dehydrogenase [Burkholderia oklahomensis EO147]MDN7675295.1 zinc-binding alcohol dehydrogenase family protein [Burkholderia oklahomensis]QPS39910.1 zinc-binding alcohol dehydrogenase family protein [Burkholderia oklahomensis]
MKAAVVQGAGQRPSYTEFDPPHASPGHRVIDVSASALSRLAQARASGAHYSSTGRFPFVAGVDGTGRLDDGRRVYFLGPQAPFGAMAERTLVPEANCVPLPDSLDDVTAAAIAIPGMSSWAALTERARLAAGETVLVNGATGASGRLAVRIAKHLGAAKVIATGRNADVLEALKSAGADFTISLTQDDEPVARAFETHFRAGVDVVLDYLWGASARSALIAAAKASPDGHPVRFVQIGTIGGADVLLPGAVLRATAITLMGSGIGSISLPRLLNAARAVFGAADAAGLRIDTETVPIARVHAHWDDADSRVRPVFTMNASG